METKLKRAIVLSGGGPAVGLSLGALQRLDEETDIQFDVWSTSCIGGWLAALYNQAPAGQGSQAADAFFRSIFQPDDVYARYPVAHAFTPNLGDMTQNLMSFVMSPDSYRDLVVPHKIIETMMKSAAFTSSPSSWTSDGINDLFFNHWMAAHPVSRFFTSMVYLSPLHGLSQLYHPDSALMRSIDFAALNAPGKPAIYHNAYNLTDQRIELFSNKSDGQYAPISLRSLCACSALPFIEDTVKIDGKTYCEGALVDAVGFGNLVTDHPDLEEIWISRILDVRQIHEPKNLTDALTNLIMLFAAKASENEVELFRLRLKEQGRDLRIIEIPVAVDIDLSWTHSNLDRGISAGYRAADETIATYRTERRQEAATDDPRPLLPIGTGGLGPYPAAPIHMPLPTPPALEYGAPHPSTYPLPSVVSDASGDVLETA